MTTDELQALDRMLAEKVMGYQVGRWGQKDVAVIPDWKERGLPRNIICWHPTTDIAQAFMVAEKIGLHVELVRYEDGKWKCTIVELSPFPRAKLTMSSRVHDPALAISLAAKAWLERGGDVK